MNRIPPSQKIGKKTEELLRQGLSGEADVTSLVIHLGIERVVQEMVEQEVTDYLEREHYQRRRPEQEHRGYRNSYVPGCIRTAEGEMVLQVPQVRDAPETYRSQLMTFFRGNSDVLGRLAVELEIERARLVAQLEAGELTEGQIETLSGFVQKVAAGIDVGNADFETQRAVIEALHTEATLFVQDGQKWVRVGCALRQGKEYNLHSAPAMI